MAALTGQTIGNFLIQEELGRGAMGVVFKAKQLSMDRFVALKFLPKSLAQDPKIVARFMREAHAAGQLSHPNVVGVHDVGVMGGLHYIAMEFIDGSSVQKRLRERGHFSEAEVLDIAGQIAEALKFAHARGILHRDIKPDNFLIDASGRVRLADLGLARITKENNTDAGLTQDGTAMGTPHYMSPEQCRGLGVDHRSDLYSLGASMFVMATGHTPYEAPTTAAILVKVLTEPPRSLRELGPDLSDGFAALVCKLMAKEQAGRFSDAQAVLDAMALCKQGKYAVSKAAPQFLSKRTVKAPPSRWMALGVGAAAALLLLLGLKMLPRSHPVPQAQTQTPPSPNTAVAPAAVKADSVPSGAQPGMLPPPPGTAAGDPPSAGGPQTEPGHFPQAEIDGLLRRNPRRAIQRLQELRKNAVPPWVVQRNNEKMAAAEKALKDLEREYAELQAAAQASFDQGRRGEAVQSLWNFSQAHEDSKEGGDARKEAARMIDAARQAAAREADAGKVESAIRMLQNASQTLPGELTADARQDIARFTALQAGDAKEWDGLRKLAQQIAREPDARTGRAFRFGEAAQSLREGQARLKTSECRSEAAGLAQLYSRAQGTMDQLRVKTGDKTAPLALNALGRFKQKGAIAGWSDAGLSYQMQQDGMPPQLVPWKDVTPENILELAQAAKLYGPAVRLEQFELGALAFACGLDSAARAKLTAAAAEPSVKNACEAALRALAPEDPREARAKELFDEAVQARNAKNAELARKNAQELAVKYADTKFVAGHRSELQGLQIGGPAAKLEGDDGVKADLKKSGWTERGGEWLRDPKNSAAFLTRDAELGSSAAKEVRVTVLPEPNAAVGVFLRCETPEMRTARRQHEWRMESQYHIKTGPGYGVQFENGKIAVYGSKKLDPGLPLMPIQQQTYDFPAKEPVAVILTQRDRGFDISINGRMAFSFQEPLRNEGDTRIIGTGNVKLISPAVK